MRIFTVYYGKMAEILSNGPDVSFAFHLKYKLGNICPMMYHSETRFELNMVNTLLILLILRKTGIDYGEEIMPSRLSRSLGLRRWNLQGLVGIISSLIMH